jgi:hypothetical protein
MRRGAARYGAVVAVAASLAIEAGAADAVPIVSSPPPPSLPAFRGAAVKVRPLRRVTRPPQNPFLARNPFNNVHNDTWMTDSYLRRGPVGRSPSAVSTALPLALCGSLTFDRRGRIVTVCPSTVAPPQARIIDPDSLAIVAGYDLPEAPDPPGTKPYQDFSGGGYFFLDPRDRIWVPTKTDHIFVIGESPDGQSLVKLRDYDLTGLLDEGSERITSALPDFEGRLWFVSKRSGKVGILDKRTGVARVRRTGEEIENSFAVGRAGVYIASDRRMYRFAAVHGRPKVVWSSRYRNSGIVKPSQVDAGTGTTPTIIKGGYVAITDNADPMDVVVYRTARELRGRRRVVCRVPVFSKGKSATENSLIAAGRSLIVENNYGYQDPFGPDSGALTRPGFARVDIGRSGRGCRRVWTNRDARAPTAVPKLSERTGLIYTYTRDPDPSGSEGYYWTAIRFRNGRTAWKKYAGSGLLFNNNYAGLALGPDGAAYLGVIGGMLALRDAD